MTDKKVTRRKFVADTGKIGLGVMIVPRHVLGGVGFQAPSDTINFAVVGFGGMGSENALELAKTENLVAFADVDFGYSEKQVADKLKDNDKKDRPEGITLKQKFDKAARYSDFREMLDKQKDIDGIVIATPDHLHAVVAKSRDAAREACVRAEAAHLFRARSARPARHGAGESKDRDADGESGALE